MNQRVGTCSICGGDVTGFRGVWMAIIPPPPDSCSRCGAKAAYDVIPMVPSIPMQSLPPEYGRMVTRKFKELLSTDDEPTEKDTEGSKERDG